MLVGSIHPQIKRYFTNLKVNMVIEMLRETADRDRTTSHDCVVF